MSKGANLAAQEIRIDLAVLPQTKCQGLFNQYINSQWKSRRDVFKTEYMKHIANLLQAKNNA